MIGKELKGKEMSEWKNDEKWIVRIPRTGADLRRLGLAGSNLRKWINKMDGVNVCDLFDGGRND